MYQAYVSEVISSIMAKLEIVKYFHLKIGNLNGGIPSGNVSVIVLARAKE